MHFTCYHSQYLPTHKEEALKHKYIHSQHKRSVTQRYPLHTDRILIGEGLGLNRVTNQSIRHIRHPTLLPTLCSKLLCVEVSWDAFLRSSEASGNTTAGQHSPLCLPPHQNTTSQPQLSFPFHSQPSPPLALHSPCGPLPNCGLSSVVEMTYIR